MAVTNKQTGFAERMIQYQNQMAKKQGNSFADKMMRYQLQTGSVDFGKELSALYDMYKAGHTAFANRYREQGNSWRGDTGDYLSSVSSSRDEYNAAAEAFRKKLGAYGRYLSPEWVGSVKRFLNDSSQEYKKMVDYATSDHEIMSQFQSEDDYSKYISGWLSEDPSMDESSVAARKQRYQRNKVRIEELEDQMSSGGRYAYYSLDKKYGPQTDEMKARKDEYEALKAENLRYDREQKRLDDYFVPKTAEFLKNATYRDYGNPTMDEIEAYEYATGKMSALENAGATMTGSGWVDKDGNPISFDYNAKAPTVKDKLGFFIHYTREAPKHVVYSEDTIKDVSPFITEGYNGGWAFLEDKEIDIYYDLFKREGQQAAYDFLDAMQTILNKRQTQSMEHDVSNDDTAFERIVNNVISIPANVFGGVMAFVDDAAHIIQGKDINPYSTAHRWQNFASAVREDTAKDIVKATDGAAIPLIDFTWGDAYQAAMSGADSMFGSIFGGTGYGVMMGMGAASSEMKRLYEMGASQEQMAAGGLLAGAAEMVFEKYSMDKFIKMKDAKSIGTVMVNVLKQGGVEASEEVFTEISNTITNAVVMGSQSDWQKYVDQYEKQGYSEAQASVMALFNDVASNVVKAGISGFISGAGMGGTGSAKSYVAYKGWAKMTGGQIIESGRVTELQADAQQFMNDKAVKKYADAVEKNPTAENVGRLADAVEEAYEKKAKATMQAEYEKQGLSQAEAKVLAEYNWKKANDLEVSAEETRARDRILEKVNESVDAKKAEIKARLAEESAPVLKSNTDFKENGRTQVYRVGKNYVAIIPSKAEDGAVTYSMGLGESVDQMRIVAGLSADVVRRQMDKLVSDAKAAEQQAGGVSVQGDNPSVTASGDTSLYTREAQASASGEASGQGAALAGGATNGQGMQQNAVESEKKAATRADGKARTRDIRETRGGQWTVAKNKARHSVEEKEHLDNYTKEQYNNFGWVRYNDILTKEQMAEFTSKFADAKKRKYVYPKNRQGEFMIAIEGEVRGVDNTIVFAGGEIESPKISKIIHIREYDGTILESERRNIYEIERRGIRCKAGGILGFYYAANFPYYEYVERESRKDGEYYRGVGEQRGGRSEASDGAVKQEVKKAKNNRSVNANQQTSDETEERKKRQEQAEKAGELWHEAAQIRAGKFKALDELRTEARTRRAVNAIPEFERLKAETRRRIYSMMESAEQNGVDEKVQRELAVLLANDAGLEIRFDAHIRSKGFYCELSGGAALMVIHADALNGLRQTLTHELVHELQNQPGYERIHAAALKAVGGKDSEAYQRIRRAVVKDYTAFGEQLDEQEIEAEVVARIIEQQIDNAKFWSRFRQHKGIRGAIDFIRELGSRMKRHGTKDAKAAATVAEELADAVWASVQGIAKRTREGVNARGQSGGTRYSFAGVKAKTADRTLLAQAKERIANREDSDTVRRDTGWFKGYDGKWRFEIDDSEIEIAFNGKYSRDPDIRRYAELVEKVYFLDSATEQEQKELVTLDKKLEGKKITPNKLGDMIKHPTLFESYPQLADLDIYFHDGNTDQASYHPGFKEIAVPKRLKMDAKKFKKTLLHEIQHAVQDIEGFASGSNPDMFNNTGERSAYDQYKSTAGEIEARDTANRTDFSKEQRKNTRPDIDREDVIFAEGGIYYAANSKRAQEDAIRTQIRDHLDEINQMTPVVEVTFDDSKITDNIIAKKLAVEEFKKIGGQVDRQNFGIILIGKDEVGKGIGYVHTPAERAALFTVPKVLKRGKIIYAKENHKENGFPTVTIAAPVIINGKRAVVGAVVQKTGKNKYHAHRILLPDGSVFVLNKTDAELSTASMLRNETQQRLPNNSASNNSIAQKSKKSTPKAQHSVESFSGASKQQTSGGVSSLLSSLGIKGAVPETRESLVALQRMAGKADADPIMVKKTVKTLAMSMAREVPLRSGESYETAAERIRDRLLSWVEANEIKAETVRANRAEQTRDSFALAAANERRQKKELREELRYEKKKNYHEGRIKNDLDFLNKIRHDKDYTSAALLNSRELNGMIDVLLKIKTPWRLKQNGGDVRRAIKLFVDEFYNPQNPLFGNTGEHVQTQDEEAETLMWSASIYNDAKLLADRVGKASENDALTLEEMQALERVIKEVSKIYREFDAVWVNGKRALAKQVAAYIYSDMVSSIRTGKKNGLWQAIEKGYVYRTLDPRAVFRSLEGFSREGRFTALLDDVQRGEIEAQAEYLRMIAPLQEFIDKTKGYEKRLTRGKIVFDGHEVSVGQAISIYQLSRREQAMQHLLRGGIKWEDAKGNSHELRMVTESQIAEIKRQLTSEDMSFISLVDKLCNEVAKQVKADADKKYLGHTNILNSFYYPIQSERSNIPTDISNAARVMMQEMMTIYNISANKNTQKNAHNQLFIGNVVDVVFSHARQISSYAHLYGPLTSFSKIYNAKVETENGDTMTIRKLLDKQWGASKTKGTGGADEYLTNLLADIQGARRGEQSMVSRAIGKLRRGLTYSALGANLKTVISQLSSYPMAFSYLDIDCLAKALTCGKGKESQALMDQYCTLAYVKNTDGNAIKAAGVLDQVGKVAEKTMVGISAMDRELTLHIFHAARYQIAKDKGLSIDSEQCLREAGELATMVMLRTQSGSLTSERSGFMRSTNELERTAVMFTSDAMKHFSRLFEAVGTFRAERARLKADRSRANIKAYREAKSVLTRTVTGHLASSVLFVLIGRMFTWLYDKDEDEGAAAALGDLAMQEIGMLPFIADVASLLVDGYEANHFTYEMINNFGKNFTALWSLASDAIDGKDVDDKKLARELKKLALNVSQATGMPVRNVYNTFYGLLKRTSPENAYKMNSVFYDATVADLSAAIESGDEQLASTVADILAEQRTGEGISGNEAIREVVRLYEIGENVLPSSVPSKVTIKAEAEDEEDTVVVLDAKQKKAFTQIYSQASAKVSELVCTDLYKNLSDAEKAKAIRLLYESYYDEASHEVVGTKVSTLNALEVLCDRELLVLSKAAISAMEADVDKKGNAVSGSRKKKVLAYVKTLKLPKGQAEVVLYLNGYRGDAVLGSVARYANGAGLSEEELADIAELLGGSVRRGKIVLK